MKQSRPTVAIIYGFCEGPRLAGDMLRTLSQAGFEVTSNYQAADIVIAHSGGCFLVPRQSKAKQNIMIGLTYWPGRSIVRSLFEKIWNDLRHHHNNRKTRAWLQKSFWNLVYFWNMPHTLRMLRGRARGEFWNVQSLTVVRNAEDSFCTPDLKHIPFTHPPHFVALPDQHDDCWLNPDRYISVIQS